MLNANHSEYCCCPEQTCEVSLRGSCADAGGLRFSIRGAKIRIGLYFRIFGLIGRAVRQRAAGLRRQERRQAAGHRSSADIRHALCCARL